jgi:hypothetical protein
MAQPQK